MCVPDQETLYTTILCQVHDGLMAGHPGQDKTCKLMEHKFYWPHMAQFVIKYIHTCPQCQHTKAPHHVPYRKLQPLPIPKRPWLSLLLDHIVELPISQGHDAILVMVNQHSKQAHFIPAHTTDTTTNFAQQFVNHIFHLHGLPANIMSDQGPLFQLNWWRTVLKLLQVQPNLSTAHHPQTDGQTKWVNQILEQYLWTYCDHLQDDWCDLLPLTEFAYNNNPQASTSQSPFYINYSYHPHAKFTTNNSSVPAAQEHITNLQAAHLTTTNAIQLAQTHYTKQADRHQLPAPNFQAGNQVLLRQAHLRTNHPSHKLDNQLLSPFPILAPISHSTFQLKLPPTIQIHPIFHVSLLERWHPNTLETCHEDTQPGPVVIDKNSEIYQWDQIVDARMGQG